MRLARSDDVPRLLPLVEAYYRFEGIPFDPARAERALQELLRNGRYGKVWLASIGGAAVGYLVLCFGYSVENGGRDGLVDELFVAAVHRGGGIGTRLLRTALDEAQFLNVSSVTLEVGRRNPRARRFYETLGFRGRDRFTLMERPFPERCRGPGQRARKRRAIQ